MKKLKSKEERALPNFLGIGVMRGGSTWLYELLQSHPNIYLPQYRKEVHFFDQYYPKGLDWYKQFFPTKSQSENYKIIGEVTPKYIYDRNVPYLVKKDLGGNCKFIVILRDPVKRAISHYKNAYRYGNTKTRNFDEFIKKSKESINRGFYSTQIKYWFKYFNQEQFLILIFEDLISEPGKEINKIADFLEVDKEKFVIPGKTNESYIPRFHFLFKTGTKVNDFLVRKNMNRAARFVQITGKILKTSKNNKETITIPENTKKKLYDKYQKDILELEKLLNKDLSIWKKYR